MAAKKSSLAAPEATKVKVIKPKQLVDKSVSEAFKLSQPKSRPATKDKRPIPLSAPYDILAVPLNLFDWKQAGVTWNPNMNGLNDFAIRDQFERLVDEKYVPEPIGIFGNAVYFFFRKK